MWTHAPDLLREDRAFITDRFSGLHEWIWDFSADNGLAYFGICSKHLLENVKSACGPKFDEKKLWAVQGAQNQEEHDQAWASLAEKHPAHCNYLKAVRPEAWIALEAQNKCGAKLFRTRTSNVAEQLHSAERALETRGKHVPDLVIDVFERSPSVVFKVVSTLNSQARKGQASLTAEAHKQLRAVQEASGPAQLLLRTSELQGKVKIVHEAAVDLTPGRLSCSRCDFVQV